VASAIEEQDAGALSGLPGVGPATAERIIAKLRRKVPKFALLVATADSRQADVETDVVRETYDVLRSLGHTESDSRRLIDAALAKKKKYKTVEELIQAIYQQEKGGEERDA
jgi:Holliday junction DNA helicase RuvA